MTLSAPLDRGRRLAAGSILVSILLSAANVGVGLLSQSTSVVAIGVEFAGDVLASAAVLVGLLAAGRPADANHPYGHGRVETVAGLLVGFILVTAGIGIVWQSFVAIGVTHAAPGWPALAVLIAGIAVRATMAALKFRTARRLGGAAIRADAWNDAVDTLSGLVALGAVWLARVDPARFLSADDVGGMVVGVLVVYLGVRLVRGATLDLADTMPDASRIDQLRRVAMGVPGVVAVEKQFARKTGLQYHVDLHIEVDPEMTVRESHRIAHDVQACVVGRLPWVAGVLVHIEPANGA